MRKSNKGVTLMELLVVMTVVGILASIAIPTYRNYVIRANRADAKAALLATAGALERCMTRFNSYAEDDGCAVALPVLSPEGKYEISAATQTSTTFELLAEPQEGQAGDTQCGIFTLNHANAKGVAKATETWQRCWGR
jgi:type IV pilus assembly protein PilE